MDVERAVDRVVLELAEAQHGVVARRQLLALGLGRGAIEARARNGRLVPVARGVYALGHRPTGHRTRWMTGVLTSGPRAVLSGRSAAALWDLHVAGDRACEVTVPANGTRVRRPGIVARREADLPSDEVTSLHAIPVTTVARTLVDLGRACRPAELRRAVERADQLELFDLRVVAPIVERRSGRAGVAALARLLHDAAEHGLPATRSLLEAEFFELCLAHRLPRPQVNRWDGSRECDFRWPGQRVVVETDSWQFHGTRAAFERDAARSQALAAEGWTLLRVTWRQVMQDPGRVAVSIRAAFG